MSFDNPEIRKLQKDAKIRAPKKRYRQGLKCVNAKVSDDDIISAKFCEKSGCTRFSRSPLECKNRRVHLSPIDTRWHHTTLRNRASATGMYYRKV